MEQIEQDEKLQKKITEMEANMADQITESVISRKTRVNNREVTLYYSRCKSYRFIKNPQYILCLFCGIGYLHSQYHKKGILF